MSMPPTPVRSAAPDDADDSLALSRRHVLQGLLASSIPSSLLLGGCSDGKDGTDVQPFYPEGEDTVAVLRYSAAAEGGMEAANQASVTSTVVGVRPVDDRFKRGEQCYWYDGRDSFAISEVVDEFVQDDFALSFWFLSASNAAMVPVQLTRTGGSLLQVRLNEQGTGIAVTFGDQPSQVVSAATAGTYTNDVWRHVHAQLKQNVLEVFVDGVLLGSVECADVPRKDVQVRIGGYPGYHGAVDDLRIHTRTFDAAEVPNMVYVWTAARAGVHADAIAIFYRCDEFEGVAVNDTGKIPDAITYGIAPTTDRFGNARQAYLFDGQTSYMQLAVALDPVPHDFAIAFWARTNSLERMVAFSAGPGEQPSMTIALNDAGAAVTVRVGDANIAVAAGGTAGQLADGAWHFYLIQRSGTELQLLVDGEQLHSVACGIELWGVDAPMRIGRSFDGDPNGSGHWNGAIDDVQIYIRSFTSEEAVRLQSLAFLPRDGAGALSFAGRAWLFGGWNPSRPDATDSEVWSSADGGGEWTLVADAPWEGRHNGGYAVLGGRMWIVGGDQIRGHAQNDVWSSANGTDWTLVTADVPWRDRMGHHVVAFADRLWLLGGEQVMSDGTSVMLNDVYSSTDGADWRLVTPNAPWSGRSLVLGRAVFRGRIWMMGGGSYSRRQFMNDVWSTPDGLEWTRVTEQAPWSARQFHSVAVYHDKLWVVAGIDRDNVAGLNDVWYSDDGVEWTQLRDTPWEPRHAASVVAHDDQIWMAAGGANTLYNDVWRLGYAP